MVRKIQYNCSKPGCTVVGECEVGFYASLRHTHETSDGEKKEWYPVRIIGIREME